MDPFKTPMQEQLSAPGQAAHGSDNLGEGQKSELSQYQLDNLNCPLVFIIGGVRQSTTGEAVGISSAFAWYRDCFRARICVPVEQYVSYLGTDWQTVAVWGDDLKAGSIVF